MPDTFVKAVVTLENDSLQVRDAAVNTWYFRTDGFGTEDQRSADIAGALSAFYNAIDAYLSQNINSPMRIELYDHADATPRTPIWDVTQTLGIVTPVPLPNEVASCLSFRSALTSGVNRRRAHGRVYIGPLNIDAATDSVGDTRPNSAFRTAVTAAADAYLLPVPNSGSLSVIEWSQFSKSRALGLGIGVPHPANEPNYTAEQLDDGYKPVVLAWVDDAFDTQRRRGLRPSTRTEVS